MANSAQVVVSAGDNTQGETAITIEKSVAREGETPAEVIFKLRRSIADPE